MAWKLYILIRNDIPPAYQAVQGGHAVAQWIYDRHKFDGHKYGEDWQNNTLVYCSVDDEKSLINWCETISIKDMEYSMWTEPDMGNQLTAIACYTAKSLFKKLPLINW